MAYTNCGPSLLSVIVPVFNGADTLGGAIRSILNQAIADVEIIVVDDGSTDASAALAAEFGPPVSVISQANQGPAAARNAGLQRAHGGFISFLDADDRWPGDRARHHLALFAQEPDAGIVIGRTQIVRLVPVPSPADAPVHPAPMIQHQLGSATYRRDVFSRVGLFDPALRLGEDREWFQRAMRGHVPIVVTDRVALEYQIRPGSLTYGVDDHQRGFLAALRAELRRRRQGAGSNAVPTVPS